MNKSFFFIRLLFLGFLFLPIHPVFKILLTVMASDSADCYLFLFQNKAKRCYYFEYHALDKVNDLITMTATALALPYRPEHLLILLVLLFYRAVGVFKFIQENHKKWTLIFPDFVRELLFVFILFQDKSKKFLTLAVLAVILFKVPFEYIHHYKKNNTYANKPGLKDTYLVLSPADEAP